MKISFDEEKIEKNAVNFFLKQYNRLFIDFLNITQTYTGLNQNSYVFFHTNAKHAAATIANYLHEKKHGTPTVRSPCAGKIYQISVYGFHLCSVWQVSEEIFKIIDNGKFIKPRAYLIAVYRDLYDPIKIDDFLMNQSLVQSLSKHKKKINGGGDMIGDLELFKLLKDEVFVGKKAFNFYLNEPMEDIPYEIISSNVSKTILKFKGYHIETFPIPILSDLTLTRTKISKNHKDIVIIYNSAEYDLIPFFQKDVKIANIYVTARFALINIWLLKIHNMREKLDIDRYKFLSHYYREMHDLLITKEFDREYYLPDPKTENYYGYNKVERLNFAECKSDVEYNPGLAKRKKNHYLTFKNEIPKTL